MAKRKTLTEQVKELQALVDDHKRELEIHAQTAKNLRLVANTLPHDSEKRKRILIVADTLEAVSNDEAFDLDEKLESEID